MREAGVKLLIADPYSDPSLVRQIADKTGHAHHASALGRRLPLGLFERERESAGAMIELFALALRGWPGFSPPCTPGSAARARRGVIFVDLALAQVAALGITVGDLYGTRYRASGVLVRDGLRGRRRGAFALAGPTRHRCGRRR